MADISCFHFSALLKRFLFLRFVHMLKFGAACLAVLLTRFALSVVLKDDFVIFVSLCLCVFVGRIIGLGRKGVIEPNTPRTWRHSLLCFFFFGYFCFLHILWLIVPNSQRPVKGGLGQFRAMWLIAWKGKPALQIKSNWHSAGSSDFRG